MDMVIANVLMCFLAALMLSSCAPKIHWEPYAETDGRLIEDMPEERPYYKIQASDKLEFKFFYNHELDDLVQVYPDGRINLQLVGEVFAEGLTLPELKQKVTSLYQKKLLQTEFTIIIRSFTGQHVFVGGEVNRPGTVPLEGKVDVLQAIYKSGGMKTTGKPDSVIVISRGPNNIPEGKLYNLEAFISGSPGAANGILNPYDIVIVPKTEITMVNEFIDQYIRQVLPFSLGASWTGNYYFNNPL